MKKLLLTKLTSGWLRCVLTLLTVFTVSGVWADTYTWDLKTWGAVTTNQQSGGVTVGTKTGVAPYHKTYTTSETSDNSKTCDLIIQLGTSSSDKISKDGVSFNGKSSTGNLQDESGTTYTSGQNVRYMSFTAPVSGKVTITGNSQNFILGTKFNATSGDGYIATAGSDSKLTADVTSGTKYYIYATNKLTFTKVEIVSATKLSAPTNLSSSDVTSTGAKLSWNAVDNASSYTLKIGETEYSASTNSYTASGLTANTEYTWQVKAVGTGSYASSDYSTASTFTTSAATEKYTVSFNAGEHGTYTGGDITEASAGAGITLPSATANTGYTFLGWGKTSSTTADAGEAGATYKPSSNCTLYAVYAAKTYAITLNANGGSAAGSATATYNSSSLTGYTAATPASGYGLNGYYTATTGGTQVIDASGNLVASVEGYTDANGNWTKDGTATLYAQWTAERTLYSWESPSGTVSQTGGTATSYNGTSVVEGNTNVNYENKPINGDTNTKYYTMRLNDAVDYSANHVQIALNEKLQAGDIIRLTAYYTKDTNKDVGIKISDGNKTEIATTANLSNLYNGGTPVQLSDITITETQAANNISTLMLTRTTKNTTAFITKLEIVTTRAAAPSISAADVAIAATATSGEISYNITNPTSGVSLTAAKTTGDWISNVAVDATNNKVTFSATANTETTDRTGTITLSYTGATDKVVNVTQSGVVVKYDITASAPVGGTYTVKVGDGDAQTISEETTIKSEKGTTITLTINPNSDCKAYSTPFVVKDADNNEVAVASGTDNYTFTMPAKAVTITAQFQVNAPTATLGAYNFANNTYSVTLSTTTSGAGISYTIDGTTWYTYSEAVAVPAGKTLTADARKDNMKTSEKLEYTAPDAPVSGSHSTPTTSGTYTNGMVYNAGAYTLSSYSTTNFIAGQISSGNSSINGAIKMRISKRAGNYTADANDRGFCIYVNPGYKITSVKLKMLNNYDTTVKLARVFADGSANNETTNLLTSEVTLPYASASSVAAAETETISMNATDRVTFVFTAEGKDASGNDILPNQAQILIDVTYEAVTSKPLGSVIEGFNKAFSTLSAPQNYQVTGATAYKAKLTDNAIVLTAVNSNNEIIPAGAGVVIAGDASASYSVSYTSDAATATMTDNELVGTTERISTPANCVALNSSNATFQSYTGAYFPANKAYMVISKNDLAKVSSIKFADDIVTAISDVKANVNNSNAAAYNLAGQRVSANSKGIVIINGKKVYNK